MSEPLRDPRETRDRQIKKLIDTYEKNTQSAATTEKRREIVDFVTDTIMPQTVYNKDRK